MVRGADPVEINDRREEGVASEDAPPTRRLAAILAADVVGFSRLAGAPEATENAADEALIPDSERSLTDQAYSMLEEMIVTLKLAQRAARDQGHLASWHASGLARYVRRENFAVHDLRDQ